MKLYKFDINNFINKNMNCFPKKNKKIKPLPIYEYKNNVSNDKLYCYGCKSYHKDLEKFIICGRCDRFFHCKIAGECIGRNCMNPGFDGEIHRTKYCYDCIKNVYDNDKCLCRNCYEN